MKKTLLTLLVLSMLIMSMGIASMAVTSTAAYATTAPVIDGVIDPIWDTTVTQDYIGTGDDWTEGDVTAYTKILWDETALYYLVVVTDTTIGPDFASQANDSINLWISETNTEAGSFNEDVSDYMYMVTSTGHTLHDIGAAAGIEYDQAVYTASLVGYVKTNDGYIVEIKQPFVSKITPEAGYIFGYTFSVNDDRDGDAARDAYVHSASAAEDGGSASNYWSATEALGEVELLSPVAAPEVPTEPVAPVEPDPAPVVDPEPVNPSTADVSGLFYILAAASAVCGCFLTKKN